MNPSGHTSPPWHPDELAFLREHGALAPGVGLDEFEQARERWIHSTLREVFLSPLGLVAKRYTHFPGRRDHRRVWQREHNALARLRGLNVPDTRGYLSVNHGRGVTGVLHLRTMLPGTPAQWSSAREIEMLAQLLAQFHQRLVVTLDPQQENFIITDVGEGRLGFIDFGRARTFRARHPLMLFNVGKELAKLGIEGGLTETQLHSFFTAYERLVDFTTRQWKLIGLSQSYWQKRHARKARRKRG